MWYVCDRQAQWIGVQGQYLSCDFFSSIDLWAKESDTKIKQGGDENIVNRSITNSTGLIWSSRGIFDKDVKQVEFQIYEFFTFYYMSDS